MEPALQSMIMSSPRVMRELPRLLPKAGLRLIATQAHVYAEAGSSTFMLNLAETYAPLTASTGQLPAAHVDAWLADQRRSAATARSSPRATTTPTSHDADPLVRRLDAVYCSGGRAGRDARRGRRAGRTGIRQFARPAAGVSDGVFAIAMTLLALDLRLPDLGTDVSDAQLRHALGDDWHGYLAFVISFYVVANYWGVHRRAMRAVTTVDTRLISHTLPLLLLVAALPFPGLRSRYVR